MHNFSPSQDQKLHHGWQLHLLVAASNKNVGGFKYPVCVNILSTSQSHGLSPFMFHFQLPHCAQSRKWKTVISPFGLLRPTGIFPLHLLLSCSVHYGFGDRCSSQKARIKQFHQNLLNRGTSTVQHGPNRNTPGPDGSLAEFNKEFWQVLARICYRMATEIQETPMLPPVMKCANINSLPQPALVRGTEKHTKLGLLTAFPIWKPHLSQ